MKHTVIFTTLLIFMQINSQEKMNLVETEYAFAEATKNSSVRDGFLEFIADDGILFRPGPVNGKEFLEASEARPGLLLWYPTRSLISSSGDLGVNFGPWEFKKTMEEESLGFGQFLTVWEKQEDGTWKFLIDMGNGHSKHEEKIEGVQKSIIANTPVKPAFNNYSDLEEIEKMMSKAFYRDSYEKLLNKATIILRNDRFPITGEEIQNHLSKLEGYVSWEPIGGKASSANDLAYTYGKGIMMDNEMKDDYEFYYLHVYVKDGENWKLRYDVVNEIQQQE